MFDVSSAIEECTGLKRTMFGGIVMNYFVTIGIEIHCELKTNTKMFSGAPVRFGEIANTCTSVVDLGHPGCLPCVNKEAVALAIKACTDYAL